MHHQISANDVRTVFGTIYRIKTGWDREWKNEKDNYKISANLKIKSKRRPNKILLLNCIYCKDRNKNI